jgi:hypothetical protein
MADKNFKVKTGLDLPAPLPVEQGGTGQTSTANTINSLMPIQSGQNGKFLVTDGNNLSWGIPEKGIDKGVSNQRPVSGNNGDLFFNTEELQLEVYQNGRWLVANTIPSNPINLTVEDQGSNRQFNNGQASISFTPSSSGGPVKEFTVISNPGNITATSTSSPIIITGLLSNISYTYRVKATNNFGESSLSNTSSATISTTVPNTMSAPNISNTTNISFGSSPSQTVSWSAPSNGGKAILDYTVSMVNGPSQTITSTSAVFSNLIAGTQYSYRVTARNDNGSSSLSNQSSNISAGTVPQAPTITSVTASGSTIASINFNAGNNGGIDITQYRVTASPGNIIATGSSSPISVPGLSGGANYTFTVAAQNPIGYSLESSGSSFTMPQPAPSTVEYLVVAGGGTGLAGGGGAGGFRTSNSFSVQPGTNYTITVGAGGSNSQFGSLTSSRGGAGGNSGASGSFPGQSGGSGGGGGRNNYGGFAGGTGNLGAFSPSEGNAGGTAVGTGWASGGGAGAAGNGGSAAVGGAGLSSSITGTSTFYAGGGGAGAGTYGSGGNGGAGGGGRGRASLGSAGTAGTANTGGGGGGGSGNYAGGSGVVIIAYPNTFSDLNVGAGLTHTLSTARSGFKVYRFTAGTGTVSWS